MLDLIAAYDVHNYLLTCLVHIQRADSEFHLVDLANPSSVLSHFRELCMSFVDIPEQLIDEFFDDISRVYNSPDGAASKVMRQACEDVHTILVQSRGRMPGETASEVITVLDDAIIELVDMVEDTFDEGDAKILRNRKFKDQVAKDPAARSSEYELLG